MKRKPAPKKPAKKTASQTHNAVLAPPPTAAISIGTNSPTPSDDERLVSAEWVAELIGCHVQSVYKGARLGWFAPGIVFHFNKNTVRFDRAKLREWIAAGGFQNPERKTREWSEERRAKQEATIERKRQERTMEVVVQ